MSEHLSELLELLVEDLYGELSSKVFSTLVRHGRLPLNGLAHFSGLVVRLLKHGLIVLIQQNLAFHYNDPKDDTTYYEADWRNAYALVRSGKAIELVEQKFGDKAGGLVLNLQLFGHTRVQDFADAYGLSLQKKNHVVSDELHINGDGLPNGTGGNEHRVGKPQSKIESIEQFHAILHELSQAEYLIPVNEHSFQPPADFQAEAEFTISVSKGAGGPKGKAAKADYARDVTALKRKWRDGEDDASVVSTKKRKLNGSLANGINGVNGDHSYYPEMFTRLDDETVVRLSHEKISVALRHQRLVDLAARYLGEATSKVYEGLLEVLERKIPRCYDEYDGLDDDEESDDADPAATCDDISDYLKPDLDLSQGISADLHLTNGVNGVSAGADQDDASQRLSQTPTDDNTRLVQIERHLRTLSSDPREFVSWFNSTRGVKWRVPFDKLSRYLIQQEIDDTVTARFGCQAARIVRILHDKGKLDEKQISQFAMVKNKEIRSTLTAMQEAGFVETQEVPKDSTRQPSRTIYLWFFDQDRVRRLLLNDTYKCMARLLQRVLVEKNKIKPVIEKAERTDVVGNEDRYLTVGERHTLRKWKETEEKLLVQLGRQDDLVATLRDFLPEVAPS